MTSIVEPEGCRYVDRGLRGQVQGRQGISRQDWDQLLGHVEAITGFPSAVFVEELTQVSGSLRDSDEWVVSTQKTISMS